MQIENRLTANPTIRESAAVAIPDDKYGEVVGVFIVRQPNESDSEPKLGIRDVRDWVARGMNPQVSSHLVTIQIL